MNEILNLICSLLFIINGLLYMFNKKFFLHKYDRDPKLLRFLGLGIFILGLALIVMDILYVVNLPNIAVFVSIPIGLIGTVIVLYVYTKVRKEENKSKLFKQLRLSLLIMVLAYIVLIIFYFLKLNDIGNFINILLYLIALGIIIFVYVKQRE